MQKKLTLKDFILRKETWLNNPELFLTEVLNIKLPFHQKNMIIDIAKYNNVTIKSANGVGKTFCLAALIVWFFFCHLSHEQDKSVKVVFTAPVFSQLKRGLFALVVTFIKRANERMKKMFGDNVVFISKEPSEAQNVAVYKYDEENYIMGISTDKANNVSGIHASNMLIIFDEPQGIKDEIFSGFKGIKQGGIIKTVMIGNTTLPDGNVGKFYESFGNNSIYRQITISAFDTPNFIEPNIKIENFLKDEDDPENWRNRLDKFCKTDYKQALLTNSVDKWVNEVKLKLPNTNLVNPLGAYDELYEAGMNIDDYEFLTRFRAEFPKQETSSLFPLEQIETSMNNYSNPAFHNQGARYFGVDIGTGIGRDDSSIAITDGNKVIFSEDFDLKEPDLLQKILDLNEIYRPDVIKVERDGVGNGVFQHLEREGLNVIPIVMGGGPGIKNLDFPDSFQDIENKKKKDLFLNKRSEVWWNLKELLNPFITKYPVLLPPIQDLKIQMRAAKYWKNTTSGKIQIISKEDLRTLIKKSPNTLDAILIAFANADEINPYDKFGFINIETISNPAWS